uniref:Uncharacterized protein n=1 Tax=Daphnia galeata TaxID=27404 RepID=A0A8J2RXB9_9CRUS|nr:unnamed protein product [Daphnia galeata]
MVPFNAPDEIRTTKGDLIEFQRRFLKMIPYFHFAVYTVDSEADAGLTNVQLPVGDRLTAGVDLLPFSICDFLLKRFRIPYKIVEKTLRKLCKNELGCGVNNLEELD